MHKPLPWRVCKYCGSQITRHRLITGWLLREVTSDRVFCPGSYWGSHYPKGVGQ